jgi:hypothetical protein
MTTSIVPRLALAVPSVLLAAACSSSSSGAGPTTTPTSPIATSHNTVAGSFDSCAIVTETMASNALGETVTRGVLGNATVEGGKACVFYGPNAPTPHNADVAQRDSVRVVGVTGGDAAKFFNDYKSKVPAVPLSGFPGKAFSDGGNSVSVLVRDHYLRVAVIAASGGPSLQSEKQLASTIVASP